MAGLEVIDWPVAIVVGIGRPAGSGRPPRSHDPKASPVSVDTTREGWAPLQASRRPLFPHSEAPRFWGEAHRLSRRQPFWPGSPTSSYRRTALAHSTRAWRGSARRAGARSSHS